MYMYNSADMSLCDFLTRECIVLLWCVDSSTRVIDMATFTPLKSKILSTRVYWHIHVVLLTGPRGFIDRSTWVYWQDHVVLLTGPRGFIDMSTWFYWQDHVVLLTGPRGFIDRITWFYWQVHAGLLTGPRGFIDRTTWVYWQDHVVYCWIINTNQWRHELRLITCL